MSFTAMFIITYLLEDAQWSGTTIFMSRWSGLWSRFTPVLSREVQWWENVQCENFSEDIVSSRYHSHYHQPPPAQWGERVWSPASEKYQNQGAAPPAHRSGSHTTRSSCQPNLQTTRAEVANIFKPSSSLGSKQITETWIARANICLLESQHVEPRQALLGGEDPRKPVLFLWCSFPLKWTPWRYQ